MMQPTHTLNWPISSRLILLKLRDTRNCSRWSQRTHSTDPATTDTDTLNRLCFNQRTHSTDSLCSPADTLKSADPAASQRTYSTDPTKLQPNGRLNRSSCIRRTHSTHPVSCANQRTHSTDVGALVYQSLMVAVRDGRRRSGVPSESSSSSSSPPAVFASLRLSLSGPPRATRPLFLRLCYSLPQKGSDST